MIVNAVFAFLGCLVLIVFSKSVVGRLVQRPEGMRAGELGVRADEWTPGSDR